MIIWFISDDRYDHNKASQSKWEVIWTSQKFSTALQSPVFTSKCYSFWLLWAYKVIIKSKKWALTHVWHDKIWSTTSTVIPFVPVNRYDHAKPRKHKQYMYWSSRKFFRVRQSRTPTLLTFNFWSPWGQSTGSWAWKWPLAHVWDNRICSTCRMIIRFVSDDRYDHNKASRSKWEVIWTSENFL